tara:strand:- start:7844 stop:8362 length:519 start_codon:yes stop_codon:yes gene_type:complete
MTVVSSILNIEFRGYKYISNNTVAFASSGVSLLTESEFQSMKDEDKVLFRLIQKRDLTAIEQVYGKEDEALATSQGKAIMDLFTMRVVDGRVATHAGMKKPLGLLLTLELLIGRFDADYSEVNEEIESCQGRMVIDMLGLRLKPNGRVDMVGGDKTPLGLVRTLRRVVQEAK